MSAFDPEVLRKEFPALRRQIDGRRIIYFDCAASSLTPQPVIDAVTNCFKMSCGTVGRGVYWLAEEATEQYENARATIADFINAEPDEVIFVRNATDAINLVARGLRRTRVLGTLGDHHSNILPWRTQHSCVEAGLNDLGQIDLADFVDQTKTTPPISSGVLFGRQRVWLSEPITRDCPMVSRTKCRCVGRCESVSSS